MTIPTVDSRRYKLGKYEIRATPMAHSAHMLRYTVFVGGNRIGSMASVPSESDCRYLENPPVTPPLVPYQALYRPGRPKKGAAPRAALDVAAPRDELPHGMDFPRPTDER